MPYQHGTIRAARAMRMMRHPTRREFGIANSLSKRLKLLYTILITKSMLIDIIPRSVDNSLWWVEIHIF